MALKDLFKRKKKFKNLERKDVVDAIVNLEGQQAALEDGIAKAQDKIEDLMRKGKAESDKDMKLFYAKQINTLKAKKTSDLKRAQFLMYNIGLLNKVKDTIDDNEFFRNTSAASLNGLLADQKGLAKFLKQGLATRMGAESALVEAERTFEDIQSGYVEAEEIYGVRDNDDELLAMFEDVDVGILDDDATAEKSKRSADTDGEI